MRSVSNTTMKSNKSTKRFIRREAGRDARPGGCSFIRRSVVGLAVVLLFLAGSQTIYAQGIGGRTYREVKNSDGNTVFLLDFWGTTDGDYLPGEKSDWNFTAAQIDSIVEAAQYWVDIIKPSGEMPLASLPVYDANGFPVYETDADGNPVINPDTGQPVQQYAMQQQPVVVRIGNSNDEAGNAYALSLGNVISAGSSVQDKDYTVARPQGIIADGVSVPTAVETPNGSIVEDPNGAHALIVVGTGWNAVSGNQNQSGRVAQDLVPVIIHEFGHALGISADYYTFEYSNEAGGYQFGDVLSRWESRLRDTLGNRAKPGQTVGHAGPYDDQDDYFEMGDVSGAGYFDKPAQPTFVGKNSLELWYGKSIDELTDEEKKFGVPLEGYTNYGPYGWVLVGVNGLSHIDTTNGLMSWQNYRNYNGFTEIELAIMQDVGYDIERRNFFGKSFYVNGDGETQIVNTTGFSAWDAVQGTYTSKPNTSSYAIGAHLFAKNLNILQRGSIFADGPGAAGIRIDGSNNKLTIADTTSVVTNGTNGVALLAAYGKDHSIIHQGLLKATGLGGIGASFNFGQPVVGSKRGSYYYLFDAVAEDDYYVYSDYGIMPELDGALVKNFDVTGTIIGSKSKAAVNYYQIAVGETNNWFLQDRTFHLGAAIHIDETAHVENINIMNGADIQGDILSFWRGLPSTNLFQEEALVDDEGNVTAKGYEIFGKYSTMNTSTALTFGLKAAADGSATNVADPNFKITYKDNINYFRIELHPDIVQQWNPNTNSYVPVSPSSTSSDILWQLIAQNYGFVDYQFYSQTIPYSGNSSVTIVHEGDKTYADIVTPGLIDLKLAGGVTEFQGNRVHVRSLAIDAGATLMLSADETTWKTPEVHVAAKLNYMNDWLLNIPYYPERDFNKPQNNGRITGDGTFYIEQINDGNSRIYGYTGTLVNNGTIAPGAENGAEVGTINIFGDLKFGSGSVYEATLSRTLLADHDGNPVDANGNYIRDNGEVIDSTGKIVGRDQSPIYVAKNDLINVSGNTTLNGTLKVNVEASSTFDEAVSAYTILESGTFTSGSNFKEIVTDVGFLYFLPELTFVQQKYSVLAQLTAIRDIDYFKRAAQTFNETAVATALDDSLAFNPHLAFSLGYKDNKPEDLRNVYHQMAASIRANSIVMNLWNPHEMVFNHVGWGNGQMETGDRGHVNRHRWSRLKSNMLGQSPYSRRTGSFWGNYFHTSFEAEGDGNSDAYDFNRNGVTIGGEWNLTPYAALGAVIAYADSTLKQTHDKVDSDDYQLGLYFVGAPYNAFEIKAYLGMGIQEYAMDRSIRNANIVFNGETGINDRYISDTKGNTLNFSFELARPLELHPTFILRPTLGIDIQAAWQKGFKENDLSYLAPSYGSNLYGLDYRRTSFDRTLLRAGFSSETSGPRGGLRMRTFYVSNVGGDTCPISEASFSQGSNPFLVRGTELGRNYLNLGISGNLWLDGERTSSFFFDYDSNIYMNSKKIYNHSFNIGFVQNF